MQGNGTNTSFLLGVWASAASIWKGLSKDDLHLKQEKATFL